MVINIDTMQFHRDVMDNKKDNILEEEKLPKEKEMPKEIGGVKGLEPTRYGDWQHKGRVTDF